MSITLNGRNFFKVTAFIAILIYGIYFLLFRENDSHAQTSKISNFIIKSSRTFKQRQQLPDLREIEWPKLKLASIPSGVNGSKEKLFAPKFSTGQYRILQKLFHNFVEFMEECELSDKWFIHAGNLIGSFRHHDIVPWDDDVDVLIDYKARNIIWDRYSRQNRSFHLSKSGDRDKIYAELIYPPDSPTDLQGSRKLFNYDWGWPYIDLSYYIQNRTHIIEIARSYGHQDIFLKTDVFPLIFRPYNKIWIPTPKNVFNVIKSIVRNNTDCSEYDYSHIYERDKRYGRIKCEKLSRRYAFVRRLPIFEDLEDFEKDNDLDWLKEQLFIKTGTDTERLIHEIVLVAQRKAARVDPFSIILTNKWNR